MSSFASPPADIGGLTSTRTGAGVPALRAGQGRSFLWRRLHSLSGIFPIGAFLVEHFLSNAFATNGGAAYNENVRFLTGLPFVLWMLQASFEELPYEIEEAALIDGCSRLKAFLYVVIPLATPAIAASTIFAILLSWNEFLFALLFTSSKATTLPVLVSQFLTDRSLQWGEIAASSTVAILPVFIFMIFAQRYLVRGLTMGAVKS